MSPAHLPYGKRASPFRQAWKGGRHQCLSSCSGSRFPRAEAAYGYSSHASTAGTLTGFIMGAATAAGDVKKALPQLLNTVF